MGRMEEVTQTEYEKTSLSNQEWTRLLILSFAHSQGDGHIQKMMFWYIRHKFPRLRIDDQAMDDIFPSAQKAIEKITTSKGHQESTPHEVYANLSHVTTYLKNSFGADLPEQQPISELIEKMIERDLNFIGFFRWRRNRKTGKKDSFYSDSKFSFVVQYAIFGKDTGDPLFNAMYKDIGEYIQREKFRIPGLDKLLLWYNLSHPRQQVWQKEASLPYLLFSTASRSFRSKEV